LYKYISIDESKIPEIAKIKDQSSMATLFEIALPVPLPLLKRMSYTMLDKVEIMQIEKLMESLPDFYTIADRELISRAYRVAENAHKGQKRASGEPYVNHCVAVASILADLRVPVEVVVAGLLHDTVEDTQVTLKDIKNDFGEDVAKLVDGVTKLTQLPRVSRGDQHPEEEIQDEELRQLAGRRGEPSPDDSAELRSKSRRYDLVSETLRKTFLAMGEDVRVVLIKLADRLHNMRTLYHMPEQKRLRIAQETLDIFAPLANRLGIWQMKWELEDLAFRYVNPDKYKEIANNIAEKRLDREREMSNIIEHLTDIISQAGIKAEISGRPKHIYSIYRKMVRKGVAFDQVHDIRGVRIIVPDAPSAYSTLGVIHTHWRPIPGQFDDYIAVPKDNFYQSLHTAVLYDDGKTLEIQIRTPEMHQNAELGIAAHWRYKEGAPRDEAFEKKILWFRSLMEWRQDVEDAGEFVDSLKTDVFQDRVYIFTPKGDIYDLPAGSTPIDFAYHVHTDIGHRCRGAKVNGKLVSLDYVLRTGEQVEILTAKRGGPSRDWLNPNLGLVKTQRARAKIRYWFKKQAREQNINQGRDLLERELRRLGVSDINIEQLAHQFDYKSVEDLYVAIGCGDVPLIRIANQLMKNEQDEEGLQFGTRQIPDTVVESHDTITVVGLKGLLTTMARCCNPVPGDDIIGYVTRGRGATIHRSDCPNILRLKEKERLVRVAWGEPKRTYPVSVRVKAYDRDGLTRDVSNLVANEGINLSLVQAGVNHDSKLSLAVLDMVLDVKDIDQLTRVLTRIEALPNVMEAHRVRPG
jgi:guanosine-3',5'-bis(diphosphate) 3'-pyrophosphohydrolase